MKKQLVRAAAATVLGLSLTTGFAAADINTTGPDSSNTQRTSVSASSNVNNNNRVHATSNNSQDASTGQAVTNDNTTAGDASTGDARNDASTHASVSVSNQSSPPSGANAILGNVPSMNITKTGPDSDNTVSYTANFSNNVSNNNDIAVTTNSSQSSSTGDAVVTHNTEGGSASTGSASNSSNSSFTLDVSN